jgi:hypothetical protein
VQDAFDGAIEIEREVPGVDLEGRESAKQNAAEDGGDRQAKEDEPSPGEANVLRGEELPDPRAPARPDGEGHRSENGDGREESRGAADFLACDSPRSGEEEDGAECRREEQEPPKARRTGAEGIATPVTGH